MSSTHSAMRPSEKDQEIYIASTVEQIEARMEECTRKKQLSLQKLKEELKEKNFSKMNKIN